VGASRFYRYSGIVIAFGRHAVLVGLFQFLKIDLAVPEDIPSASLIRNFVWMFIQELVHVSREFRYIYWAAGAVLMFVSHVRSAISL
jgi:hypothetical protein